MANYCIRYNTRSDWLNCGQSATVMHTCMRYSRYSCQANVDFSFLFHIILNTKEDVRMKFTGTNVRPVSSFGRVLNHRAGGRGFKPQPDQHSGSLNN